MNLSKFFPTHIFLADDDDDDRLLFKDALSELPNPVKLTVARDGEHLMNLLNGLTNLPDILFLDLNMPLKNGFECLDEIKKDSKYATLPVVIFSTSSQPSAIDQVYESGAHLYVRKPNDFHHLKKVIQHVLAMNWPTNPSQPAKDQFVLSI